MSLRQEKDGDRKRKPVEVVVFEEPGRKPRTVGKSGTLSDRKELSTSTSDHNEQDFKSFFDDVKSLGLTGFSKKERRKLEEQRMQLLGARKPKGQKVPYPMLQKHIKNRKEKEKASIEMKKSMGIIMKKKKDAKNTKSKQGLGWWTDSPVNIDKASNNVRLKKSDIAAIKRKVKH